ncbi:unnamed protein product [Chondrus crispus]|uniref:Uncharacterized protein n=1 Tax=Chondrus crispus TaxID=2769 RepID=R7QKV1_CHOCR|nr:unnamed protein product [Chondrus crispus]CDF38106.1 unnamed protein product [Chondrus crispus]|eukprot:XP_005717975.1 unnamed protein product [Chondrus crispus]
MQVMRPQKRLAFLWIVKSEHESATSCYHECYSNFPSAPCVLRKGDIAVGRHDPNQIKASIAILTTKRCAVYLYKLLVFFPVVPHASVEKTKEHGKDQETIPTVAYCDTALI